MRVALVGCGFLGGLWTVEMAKRAFALKLPMEFTFFDDDQVEARNAANQVFETTDEGLDKADVLAGIAARMGCEVYVHVKRITKENDDLLEGFDLIVCAVDNLEARSLLWQVACRYSVPLLVMGISQQGTGAVDWTALNYQVDTNPFNPTVLATTEEPEKLGKVESLPPCELVAFRGLGFNVALAGAKAAGIFFGIDPENHVLKNAEDKYHRPRFTTWLADNQSHKMTGNL